MEAIINYFLDSPLLLIAVIVFIFCVIIGFFGERYLKKKGGFDKIIGNKKEEKATIQNEEPSKEEEKTPILMEEASKEEYKEPVSQPVTVSDAIDGVLLNDNIVENPILDNVYPPQNEPQNINVNQNIEVPYINNDDNINNMF